MSTPSPSSPPRVRRTIIGLVIALFLAASMWFTPAFDAVIPFGGAMYVQLGAGVLALVLAVWGSRRLRTDAPRLPARLGRALAIGAVLIVALWGVGIAILWLIWPH